MYFNITAARYLRNHEIEVSFEDGSAGKVDIGKYIEQGTIFDKLTWGNGELDIAPETLSSDATGKTVTYQTKAETLS